MEELKAQRLCMSAAREGTLMLFCATQASMVTSAMATPALPAVKNVTANTKCRLSWNHSIAMDIIPTHPENHPHITIYES